MAIYKNFIVRGEDELESSDVLSNVSDTVSSGMWQDGSGTITTFYTSSTQSGSSGAYYLDVYSKKPQGTSSDPTAKPQFSLAYGHIHGSGSVGIRGATGNRASATIYRQLTNTLLGPNVNKFTFAGSGTHTQPKFVYAISVARQQLREKMDPGNWELVISSSEDHGTGLGTAQAFIKLIDDSGATSNPAIDQGGRVFNIVSGSIATGVAVTKTTAASQPGGGYGLFYPDLGMIILNGPVINKSGSLFHVSASNLEGDNNISFFNAIAGGAKFQARREEVITSQHYFCRVPNKAFNFSSNPTFSTGSNGNLTQTTFINNPKTFITQIGLYNDNNDLLAVAKLSKPLLKSYSREAIIKVKLDF
jgi:hypothetical protein